MNVKNRKTIRRLSFKALWASRRRNIIAIAAIILTTLLFTSLFTVVLSMNSSYQTYTFRQIGGYCHGTFKDVTEEQTEAISSHPKVKAAGVRKVIGTISEGSFAKVPAEVSYMDENCTNWSYAQPTTGSAPESAKEIAMDTSALKLLGIKPEPGAQIPLTFTVGDKNQTSFTQTDVFTLTGYWEYDHISPVHYLNISEEYAREIEAAGISAGMDPFRTDLNVMMASSINIRGQMEQVLQDLGYSEENTNTANNIRIGVNWGYTTAQVSEKTDPQTLLAMAAFLILVIFTGYLIIYNIFQISVTGDIRFYGLLKTIGVTPRQLKRIIRQQALFLCILGIPAGLLLGYGVGAVLTPLIMKRSTLGAVSSTLSTSPLIFIFSSLFALATVLLSCSRPGRIASKVSPVEAAKYTEALPAAKKQRSTRGAKVHQMAFANLGRSKSKTVLVVISLALSVVLLNVLYSFVNGFDMEKYLKKQTCADFIVSSTDYFRYEHTTEYISEDTINELAANTSQTVSGCGYTIIGADSLIWMQEEAWKDRLRSLFSGEVLDDEVEFLNHNPRRGNLISGRAQIEGLDTALFDKLTVIEGDISPLYDPDSHAIALVADTDDYGNVSIPESYPSPGETIIISYTDDAYYIDSRTGEKSDENTPVEFLQYHIEKSHDVNYTICAYVTVPHSMSYRYSTAGLSFVLPVSALKKDSAQEVIPMFCLFDTTDKAAEEQAEQFLVSLTGEETSSLMYESKATLRKEFESYQNMFLILGGLLCGIIGLIGILNFFNAVMTGILSRRREFAVLQAVGMTGRQLKAMLIYEGLFYALGAAFTALLLSLILTPLAGNILEIMFWFFSPDFTVTLVLAAVPAFVLMGWLIPSAMYRQAAKQSIVDRLREAE